MTPNGNGDRLSEGGGFWRLRHDDLAAVLARRDLTWETARVYLALADLTRGWHKPKDAVSLSQIAEMAGMWFLDRKSDPPKKRLDCAHVARALRTLARLGLCGSESAGARETAIRWVVWPPPPAAATATAGSRATAKPTAKATAMAGSSATAKPTAHPGRHQEVQASTTATKMTKNKAVATETAGAHGSPDAAVLAEERAKAGTRETATAGPPTDGLTDALRQLKSALECPDLAVPDQPGNRGQATALLMAGLGFNLGLAAKITKVHSYGKVRKAMAKALRDKAHSPAGFVRRALEEDWK
jgi:hypothetical protein